MSENVVLTEQKASYVGVDTVSVTYSEIGTGTTLSPSISPSTATSAQPAPSAGLHQKDFDVLRLLDFFCEITGLDKTQFYVGAILLLLLASNIFIISAAWKYYTPIINAFSVQEDQYRAQINAEKEKTSTNFNSKIHGKMSIVKFKTVVVMKLRKRKKTEWRRMDKLKNFLKQKKVDRHFKHTGGGARLSEAAAASSTNRPSVTVGKLQSGGSEAERVHAADVAAQAALKRLHANEPTATSSQKKIQLIAQRELEKERRAQESEGKKIVDELKNLAVNEPEVREFEHSCAVESVMFTCELLGDDVSMPKEELRRELECFLLEQLQEEGVVPAALLIVSLNKKDESNLAKATILAYIRNILESPDDPKYRRIRITNKVFQERVNRVKGGREFLEAIGFREVKEGEESFLIMSDVHANDEGTMLQALDVLEQATPIPLKLSRDTRIFIVQESDRITAPKLPPDFFNLTGDELKREQTAKAIEVEKLTTMRTREMREKDTLLRDYRYKYTLVRVRTADNCLVQGVFSVHEPLSAVREWIHPLLARPEMEFSLSDTVKSSSEESKTLAELGLLPAAVLHLRTRIDVAGPIIADEHLQDAMPFTII